MALTPSVMTDLGTQAPTFDLPIANPWIDTHVKSTRNLHDYTNANVVVVIFMCNHCPYVIHVQEALVALANDYASKGVQLIGISSNDVKAYPSDSFDRMALWAKEMAYPFPYLYDETQDVAQAYHAVCTPDIFVYDAERTLAYRGRLDETRPRMGTAAHGRDLRAALDVLLATGKGPATQYPSMGCNIKWKPGNAPA